MEICCSWPAQLREVPAHQVHESAQLLDGLRMVLFQLSRPQKGL